MIKYPDNENYVYKFHAYNDNLFKILLNHELWFGKPAIQNDPFEGEFIVEGFEKEPNAEEIRNLLKIIDQKAYKIEYLNKPDHYLPNATTLVNEYQDFIKSKIKETFGICSLSKSYKNILMWTHYANSHSGVCLIFNKNILEASIKKGDSEIEFKDVIPCNSAPKVKIRIADNGYPFVNGYNILLSKFIDFKYEDEVRFVKFFIPIFDDDKKRNLKFDMSALTGIIIGENMETDNLRSIYNLLKNNSELKDISIFFGHKNIFEGSVEAVLINDKHPRYHEIHGNKPIYFSGITK